MKNQKGINTIEFAVVGLFFLILLFGILEFSRVIFVINSLAEASRRGARVAAVCPIDAATQSEINNVIRFSSSPLSITSGGVITIADDDITVSYLDKDFIDVTGTTDYNSVAFVQVSINIGAQSLAIPLPGGINIIPPSVTTTLPRESLGRTTAGNPTVRTCFGALS